MHKNDPKIQMIFYLQIVAKSLQNHKKGAIMTLRQLNANVSVFLVDGEQIRVIDDTDQDYHGRTMGYKPDNSEEIKPIAFFKSYR